MGRLAISDAVRKHYRLQFASPQGISSQYDNLPFSKPNASTWARTSVGFDVPPSGVQVGASSTDRIIQGYLEAEISSPSYMGESAALEAADALATAFRQTEVAPARFQSPSVQRTGGDGAAYRAVVRCPFWAAVTHVRLAAATPELTLNADAIGDALRTYFKSQVATPQALAAQYDDLPFVRPNDSSRVRLTVRSGGSFQTEISGIASGTHRSAGVLLVDVAVPLGTGEVELLRLVDAVDAALQSVNVQGIELLAPEVSRGTHQGSEWRISVSCPWSADLMT